MIHGHCWYCFAAKCGAQLLTGPAPEAEWPVVGDDTLTTGAVRLAWAIGGNFDGSFASTPKDCALVRADSSWLVSAGLAWTHCHRCQLSDVQRDVARAMSKRRTANRHWRPSGEWHGAAVHELADLGHCSHSGVPLTRIVG